MTLKAVVPSVPYLALSRRVEKVVGYPPISQLRDLSVESSTTALLEAATFEDLPGKWQANWLANEMLEGV
jgi:hypothetical protein